MIRVSKPVSRGALPSLLGYRGINVLKYIRLHRVSLSHLGMGLKTREKESTPRVMPIMYGALPWQFIIQVYCKESQYF